MKSRLEKVYDKMPNKKVDLKAHKVALSIVDELTSIASSVSVYSKNIDIDFEEIERLQSELDNVKNSLDVDLDDLAAENSKLNDKIEQANNLANE